MAFLNELGVKKVRDDYVQRITEVDGKFSQYATTESLGEYVKNESLTSQLGDYAKNEDVNTKLDEIKDKIGKIGSVKGEITKSAMGSLSPNLGDIFVVTDDGNHLYIYVGKTEYAGVQKYGFVQNKTELDTAIEAGTSAKIDHDTNVFYVTLDSIPETPENISVQFVVDDKTYAVGWSTTAGVLIGLGKGTAHNTDIDFVKEADSWAAHDGSEVDVTGKTVTMSVVKYSQSAKVLENLSGESETILPPVTINCSSSVNKGPIPGVDENGFVDLGSHIDLSEYAKTADVNSQLEGKANSTDLEQYVKSEDLDSKGFITEDTLNGKNYVTDESLTERLQSNNYVTEESLTSKGYIDQTNFDSKLEAKGYIDNSELETKLGDYVTNQALTEKNYLDSEGLETALAGKDYVTNTELDAKIDEKITAISDDVIDQIIAGTYEAA